MPDDRDEIPWDDIPVEDRWYLDALEIDTKAVILGKVYRKGFDRVWRREYA